MFKTIKRWFGFGGVAYTGGSNSYGRGMFQTVSGAVINEQTALTIPAFFHALRLYGQTIGSQSWDLIEHDPNRRKSIARTHPVHRLIHDEPNEFQLPSEWREYMVSTAIAWGNAYSYIERNGNFRPTATMPLLSDRTYPQRINGELVYVTTVNGVQQTLQPYQVFHLKAFSTNGISGVPLVRNMAETLGLTKAEEQFAASYFGNGANYGGMVEVPGKLSDAAMKNLKSQVNDNSGLGNAFKWIFLEEGMKANKSDSNADKAQLVESRSFQLGDMARIVGLPPHLLYDLSRSTNNNIEHQGIEAVTYAFKPWANKLCQEANRKLLYESEKGVYETVIDLKPLMAGGAKEQAEKDQIRFNCASMTPNEIRELDGRNPIDGGDQLFLNVATMPLNLIIEKALNDIALAKAAAVAPIDPEDEAETEAAEDEGQDTAPADPDDNAPADGDKPFDDGPVVPAKEIEDVNVLGSARALHPVVADTIRRLMRRESKAVRSAVAKHATAPEEMATWLAQYQTETRQHVAEVLAPVAQSITALNGNAIDLDQIATDWTSRTHSDVAALMGLEAKDRHDALHLCFEGWNGERSEQIITELIGGES